jgi:2-polyprenyl-6-methoxyphenol hydroxylase-like FAD-dependent oxidoreductase
VRPGSWIGIGTSGPIEAPAERGVRDLTMFVGASGYAGRVVTEDGVANWAAAVDPSFLRRSGGPAAAVRAICAEAGSGASPPEAGWTGTPCLTRRCPAQRGCVYRVGDAAGYVEPITGEGMSWAMLGGAALAPVLGAALRSGTHQAAWSARHGRLLAVRRARCGLVARGLRSPVAMAAAFALFGSGGFASASAVNRLIGASPGTERA